MQIDERSAQQAHNFQDQPKQQITRQANIMNTKNDGDLQDGFALTNIEDGWVSYKGYSWGFVFHYEPLSIDMTFGPDWPFVGHRSVFVAEMGDSGLIWVEQNDNQTRIGTAEQMAQYGLRRLAAKLKDDELFSQYHPGLSGEAIETR